MLLPSTLEFRGPSMPPALLVSGKCQGWPPVIAASDLPDTSPLCFTHSGKWGPLLTAANGSSMWTYGVRTVLFFFISCHFTQLFTVADVSKPLLGTDFLQDQSLLVDLRGKRLVHAATFKLISSYHAASVDRCLPWTIFMLRYWRIVLTF